MDAHTAPAALERHTETTSEPLALALLSLDEPLLRAVQARLAAHAMLDPDDDGFLGPATTWALRAFARDAGRDFDNALTPELARLLAAPATPGPTPSTATLPDHLRDALIHRGDWLCRVPETLAIVYVEGTSPDGTPSPARPDHFDDARFLLQAGPDGRTALLGAWAATTRSGQDAIDDPVDQDGPPRLEPGQYKAWVTGTTAIGTELEQDALIQIAPLPVRRDATGDHHRKGGPAQRGLFVIDQHGAFGRPRIADTSAGCLVAQDQDGHRSFMAHLRTDPRWRANNAYRFMTSLLTRAQFDSALRQPGRDGAAAPG